MQASISAANIGMNENEVPSCTLINEALDNEQITHYYSALAHPQAVQEYLDKKVALGAMFGPVSELSPLFSFNGPS